MWFYGLPLPAHFARCGRFGVGLRKPAGWDFGRSSGAVLGRETGGKAESENPPSLGGSGATRAETGNFNREISEIREKSRGGEQKQSELGSPPRLKPPAVFTWPTPGQSRHCGTAYRVDDLRVVEPPAVRDHRALRARWREIESCDLSATGRLWFAKMAREAGEILLR